MVRNWLGDVLIKKGMHDEAKVEFDAAAKLLGSYYGIHVNRGNWLLENNKFSEALEAYKKAHQLDPGRADVHRIIGYLLVEQKHYQDSLPYLQYTLKHTPNFVDGHINAAKAMTGLGRPELALKHLEDALRLDTESADAHFARGIAQHKLSKIPDAIASFQAGLAIESDASAHLDLGVIFHAENRMEEAKAQFAATLTADPTNLLARINLAAMGLQSGDQVTALSHYRAILKHHPNNNSARVHCARLLHQMGRTPEGIAMMTNGLKVQENSVLLHFHAGVLRAESGDIAGAKSHYKTATDLLPTYGPAQNNLGTIYLGEGEIKKALGHFRLAVQAQPKNSRAHNNLANALGHDEKTQDEALLHYHKSIEIDPKYGSPHFNAALIYLQRQDWGEAQRCLEQANILMPSSPQVSKRLEALAKIRAALAGQKKAQPAPKSAP